MNILLLILKKTNHLERILLAFIFHLSIKGRDLLKTARTMLVTVGLSLGLCLGVSPNALAHPKAKTAKTKTSTVKTAETKTVNAKSAWSFDKANRDYTAFLQQAVVMKGSVSKVRYQWLQSHQDKLLVYLKDLSMVAPKTYNSWTKKQKMSFLVNAYNAFTIKLIVDNYMNGTHPIKSIKDIGGSFQFWKTPWKLNFIELLWKRTSLDSIEHMLRTQFNDPRVHFAINCASIGCPELRNEAYVPNRLDSQLNEQAKLFLRDGVRNQIDVAKKKLKLSKIFDWYEDDFNKKAGSVEKFIAPYITDDPAVRKSLMNNEYSISYTTYNWNLNGTK